MRTVVVGAEGQLGRELARVLPEGSRLLTRRDVDVRSLEDLQRRFDALRPTVVLNCAAENRVDAVESDPEAAFAVNADGAANVATAAAGCGALIVHTSTDYVFGGDRPADGPPYVESDPPSPRGVYARSKLAGEERVFTCASRAVVVRTSALYARGGSRSKGGSFVDRILTRARSGEPLRVVADQVTSPTWARDVALTIATALPTWLRPDAPLGLYHFANAGACSWYELACRALALAGVSTSVEPVDTATFAAAAPRPCFSALASERLAALAVAPLRPWDAALDAYLRDER